MFLFSIIVSLIYGDVIFNINFENSSPYKSIFVNYKELFVELNIEVKIPTAENSSVEAGSPLKVSRVISKISEVEDNREISIS